MNNKCVITKVNNGICYVEFKEDKPTYAGIFSDDKKNILGNIYVGYVKDVVKNINCAFVEYELGLKSYLQLNSNMNTVFLNNKNTDKLCAGDRIIVQITKEAIKTKDPVCTTNFELATNNLVLTHGKSGIAFSKKISNNQFKENVEITFKKSIEDKPYELLFRTNSENVSLDELEKEASKLMEEYNMLIHTANTRSKNFCLKKSAEPVLDIAGKLGYSMEDRIITDDEEIFEKLTKNNISGKIELYKDDLLPLYKLHSFETIFTEIASKKVWLKSGGYLIIEYTEAMTVIDVNTGKCDKGKDKEATFLKINIEAAKEISRQLSLRNISGIIIVDFIDMKDKNNKSILFETMKEYVSNDRIQTSVVDYTKLNLMEITRKKTYDRVDASNIFRQKNF